MKAIPATPESDTTLVTAIMCITLGVLGGMITELEVRSMRKESATGGCTNDVVDVASVAKALKSAKCHGDTSVSDHPDSDAY